MGEIGSGIQNLNYSYNIRGWLEKINDPDGTNPSSTSTRKLNLGLYYNNVPAGLPDSAQYNGNISAMVWNTPPEGGIHFPEGKRGYGFSYDGLNRLKSSVYGEGTGFSSNRNTYNERLTYDLNGNIMSLSRQKKGTGVIDSLAYTYRNSGNILDRVDDAITGVNGFSELVKQAGEYGYDGNGNLISDANKGIDTIKYNFLNLPEKITGGTDHISYIYDAIGTKLARIKTTGDTVYYAGNFVYNGSSLNYILNREGMWLPTGGYHYYLKDHLGNTRMVVNTSGTGGTVVQQTDYYPFGMDIAIYNGGIENKYRYNGKEIQEDVIGGKSINWYDYGARFYDPVIGRWHSVDPLGERQIGWSPYSYCLNNPILRLDPNGLTDFTFDKKTGDVKQVGKKNDDPDRILKTKRNGEVKYKKNGEAKVAVGGIEQGILKDGQNWKTDDQVVNVGKGQPSLGGVEDFVTKMSEYVGVEVSGAYLSNKDGANADISKVYIDEYSGNTSDKARTTLFKLYTDESLKGMKTPTHFHTHLSNIGKSRLDVERPSGLAGPDGDLNFRDTQKNYFYNFLILTRTATYPTQVQKIPYTNWQK